ncbi:SPFH domain-containing protein [Thermaerobacter subterraneus]|uniref:Membrane protease subunit, stomatin/prohibitin n=1 Tax=Thermaerobacter subterraneus DSM 13965 TaxID=867903 RepID=K6PNG3_9FIRM|nr:SPFH domain-containing protein [Thermaerobacter subterraneus]EKP94432.1 membrane protease subunit, stomatin/prohibitin [Thermaerobacter subterraneus DSM 13965]
MKELRARALPGIVGVLLALALEALAVYLFVRGATALDEGGPPLLGHGGVDLVVSFVLLAAGTVVATGLVIVQPNYSRSVIFLGRYLGTLREAGWWWTVPLTSKPAVSLRVRNFESEKLKVNDLRGNPIQIAAVVVWRVIDAARALFEVDQYEEFVKIQSETALRHIASQYPYDHFEDESTPSLRENTDRVSQALAQELQERLAVAGVEVLDARLTHLAYSPEIAHAMLQRQQAEAVVAARAKIVEGAVGMVEMALRELQRSGLVDLDDERRAAMVNNLMVAIVGERAVQPVMNAGTIY